MSAQKKIDDYLQRKSEKIAIPARVYPETIQRAQAAAKKKKIPLCDFIEGALKMACDQVEK